MNGENTNIKHKVWGIRTYRIPCTHITDARTTIVMVSIRRGVLVNIECL